MPYLAAMFRTVSPLTRRIMASTFCLVVIGPPPSIGSCIYFIIICLFCQCHGFSPFPCKKSGRWPYKPLPLISSRPLGEDNVSISTFLLTRNNTVQHTCHQPYDEQMQWVPQPIFGGVQLSLTTIIHFNGEPAKKYLGYVQSEVCVKHI